MQPPPESSKPETQREGIQGEFERSLADLEQGLVVLRQRYAQVQNEQQRQRELHQRFEQLKKQPRTQELKAELQLIQDQLAALDNALGLFSESYLMMTFLGGGFIFSKSGLKEAFWQVVRFGGLGIVVGWILKSWAN